MPDRTPFDGEKLAELILYVVNAVEDPSKLGAVKLHKILYFSDLLYFVQTGGSITGASYIRMPRGPWCEKGEATIDDLQAASRLVERSVPYFSYTQRRFFALDDADVDGRFKATEISLVDSVVGAICFGHSAASISAATHNDLWKHFDDRAPLPLDCAIPATFLEPDDEAVAAALADVDDATWSWSDSALKHSHAAVQ